MLGVFTIITYAVIIIILNILKLIFFKEKIYTLCVVFCSGTIPIL